MWLALAGCGGDKDGDGSTSRPLEQGVSAMIRLADGSPATEAEAIVGSISRTDPDSAGMTYHLDLPPGRTPILATQIPYMEGFGVVDIDIDTLGAVRLELAELAVVDIPDPSVPTTVQGDGFVLEIPADAVTVDDVPWTGPWHLGWLVVGEAQRRAQPADLIAIRNDVDLGPVTIHQALGFRAWNDDGDPVRVPEPVLRLTLDLPAGSPLLSAETPELLLYSHSRTYWVGMGRLEIDPVTSTGTLDGFGALGWIGAGATAPESGCVTGRLVDAEGAAIDGATVTLLVDGGIQVDRTTSVEGDFCLPMALGSAGALEVYGMAPDRSAIYTSSTRVTGPSGLAACGTAACVDLGAVEVDVHPDADGDRYFSGPGGDCDDGDPDVNPNLAFGDGRFCGEDG